jgi:pyrroloquinoline quinone biosynthesis protein D
MTAVTEDSVFKINPTHRMQWEEAQDCFVLLYPEGMVKLSPSAAEILKRLDGQRSVNGVIADLQNAFPGADLEQDVYRFLDTAIENGWIRNWARNQ